MAVIGRAGLLGHGIEVECSLFILLDGVPEDFRLVFLTATSIDALDTHLVPFAVVRLIEVDISGEEYRVVGKAIGEDSHRLCQIHIVVKTEGHRCYFLFYIAEELETQLRRGNRIAFGVECRYVEHENRTG